MHRNHGLSVRPRCVVCSPRVHLHRLCHWLCSRPNALCVCVHVRPSAFVLASAFVCSSHKRSQSNSSVLVGRTRILAILPSKSELKYCESEWKLKLKLECKCKFVHSELHCANLSSNSNSARVDLNSNCIWLEAGRIQSFAFCVCVSLFRFRLSAAAARAAHSSLAAMAAVESRNLQFAISI